MSLNDFIKRFTIEKAEEKSRMIINYSYLSKLKVSKNYEFTEKLTLPGINF